MVGNFDYYNSEERLLNAARRISETGFVGGGIPRFEKAGRSQLMSMLQIGIYPDSKVLDIGCGCLRGGYWLIHFLQPGSYFGIEPNEAVLKAGLKELFQDDIIAEKQPQFDFNESFDFSVFEEKFDFFIARSIWTHSAKWQIERMLDGFEAYATTNGKFLTSILLPDSKTGKIDYTGDCWVGKSHKCDEAGTVAHSLEWIDGQCRQRGLEYQLPNLSEHGKQTWLLISRASTS